MKYWIDTEFIEDGETILLLSIGIVAEDDRELYLQTERGAFYHKNPACCPHAWVKQNVIPYLDDSSVSHSEMRQQILEFCNPDRYGKPEFWGYYADYDWVVFCWIFGSMINLPKGFPMYCNDIKQECDRLGNPQLPKQEGNEHHALADARHNRVMWEFLQQC